MINKGFLNSKAADASKLKGNFNVDVEGLAASMKRFKGNDEGTSDGIPIRNAVRALDSQNSGANV